MNALCLEAHQDDACLFAAFSAIRHNTHVVTVLASQVQAERGLPITNAQRARENADAMAWLELSVEQWGFPDSEPRWALIRQKLAVYDRDNHPDMVLAPEPEDGGHDHHNALGRVAREVFGDRTVGYLTYTRDGGRSTWGTPAGFEPEWVTRKLRALACFRSQIETVEAGCTPWFMGGLYEWVAP